MKKQVSLSIIMPIYNCAKYLDVSISSILNQEFADYELILIDDGSKDESWEVCQKYMRQDERVRAFHTENRGVSGARNFGIENAIGEYLYFVDADDQLFPNALEELILPMKNDPMIDVVIAYYDGTDTDVNKGDMPKGRYAIEDILEHILKNAPTFYYGVCWNKLYKASLIRNNQLCFPQGITWSEDMLFNMAYFKYCKQAYYTDSVVYFYNRDVAGNGKLYTDMFNYEWLIRKLTLEKMRIKVLGELLRHHGKEKELLGGLHDFAINRFNQCFSDVFRIKNITGKARRKLLFELIELSECKEILATYAPKKGYFFENLYVWSIVKNHYCLLYFFCLMKFKLQDNKQWQKITAKHKSIWPKFSL